MNQFDDRQICPLRSIASQFDKVCAAEECAWFNKETGSCAMTALGSLCDTLTGWDESTIPVFHVRPLRDTDVIVNGHIGTELNPNERVDAIAAKTL